MQKESGKALAIFLVLIAVILVSLTAISVFLLVKQVQLRESAEYNAAQLEASESVMRATLQEVQKQKDILEQRAKEAESKIESLLEELDLAESVREEVKKENREMKTSLEALKKENEDVQAKLAKQEADAGKRVTELQDQLNVALERNKTLEEKRQELEQEFDQLKQRLAAVQGAGAVVFDDETALAGGDVDLDTIIVSTADAGNGHVVSVDHEAEFVIVNLGENNGVLVDSLLSVSRGEDQIGEIKVTRVLPEMSAADLIPPLTSQDIAEGDTVKVIQ